MIVFCLGNRAHRAAETMVLASALIEGYSERLALPSCAPTAYGATVQFNLRLSVKFRSITGQQRSCGSTETTCPREPTRKDPRIENHPSFAPTSMNESPAVKILVIARLISGS